MRPLENPDDAKRYFGRSEIKSQLEQKLTNEIRKEGANHTIFYGEAGSGKTQTLMYAKEFLNEKYKGEMYTFYVKCPGLADKNLVNLFGELIRKLTTKFITDTMIKCYQTLDEELKLEHDTDREKVINAFSERLDHNSDLARVMLFYRENSHKEEKRYLVQRWFAGEKLSTKDKSEIGVIKDNSYVDSAIQTFVGILKMNLIAHKGEKMIVMMLDELENAKQAGGQEWPHFFRELLDSDSFAMFLCAQIETLDELTFFRDQAVKSRFPANAIIELPPFQTDQEIKEFVIDFLKYMHKQDCKPTIKEIISKITKSTQETLTEELYPFTEELINYIETYLRSKDMDPTPRYIQEALQDFIDTAITKKPDTKVIDKKIIEESL